MKLNHTELQAHVVRLLGLRQYQHLHVRRSIGKGRKWVTATNLTGWHDLWCWSAQHPGRWISLEVKVPPDTLKWDQQLVALSVAASGAEFYVVTEQGDPIRCVNEDGTLGGWVPSVGLEELGRILARTP